MLDMNSLIEEVDSWLGQTFPDHTVPVIMKKLDEEYTELLEAVKWGDDLHTADEIADVLIVLLILCKNRDINLPAALASKHLRNLRRTFVRLESGIYKGGRPV